MRCHVGQGGEAERQRVLHQYDAALGRVGGVVADPLQVAGDLQRGDDLAQVVGDRLAQGKQADDERLHSALQLVDLGVELDRARRHGGVVFHHCLGREPDLVLHGSAHLGEHGAKTRQFLVVAAHRVPPSARLESGRPPSQPNRAVMYSCVRFSLGAVKICAALPTSTISPR